MIRGRDSPVEIDAHRPSLLPRSRQDPVASRLEMAHGFAALQREAAAQRDRDAPDSASASGSSHSKLSFLDDETDELGRRILQHQRDARRFKLAASGEQAPFRKRRSIHAGVVKSLDRGERLRTGTEEILDIGEDKNEPAITLPREWGRNGRRSASWMRRIVEPSEADEEEEINDVAIAADVVARPRSVPNMEKRSMSPPSSRPFGLSTPSSMRHMNTTVHNAVDDEDMEFSNHSFLASTPAASQLPRRVDRSSFGRRLSSDAPTRSGTLGFLDKAGDGATNWKRDLIDPAAKTAFANNALPSVESPSASLATNGNTPSRIPRRLYSPSRRTENSLPNGHASTKNNTAQATSLEDQPAEPANLDTLQHRARRHGADSLGLLRKLARVSSMSPNPVKQLRDADSNPDEVNGKDAGVKRQAQSSDLPPLEDDVKVWSRHSGSTRMTSQLERRSISSERLASGDKPALDGRPLTANDVTSKNQRHASGAIPEVNRASSNAYTTARDHLLSNQPSESRHVDLTKSHLQHEVAQLPRSALEAIVREAKRGDTSINYGESTILSLEDIVRPNLEGTDSFISFDAEDKQRTPIKNEDIPYTKKPLSQSEQDRRMEHRAMESMNKHLRAAHTSLQDANRGLRRVENKIETAPIRPSPANTTMPQPKISSPCATCLDSHRPASVWLALWTEFRSLFFTWSYSPNSAFLPTWPRPSPTPLGFTILVSFLWLTLELTLCWHYCHPLYATSMVGYGVDPNAPEFPFVIPTLALRPFKWLWGPAYETLLASTAVYWNSWLPEGYGYTSRLKYDEANWPPGVLRRPGTSGAYRPALGRVIVDGGMGSSGFVRSEWLAGAAKATATRVAQSVVDAIDEVGSMWDDETVF